MYKLHAELADRIIQRSEASNRLYAGLMTALGLLLAAVARSDASENWLNAFLGVGAFVGLMLAIAWYLVIHSHRKLRGDKRKVLEDLEAELAFPFFLSRERD